MGFYNRHILPPLTNFVMAQSELLPYRERTIAPAAGRILEIGVGSGLNLPIYTDAAEHVTGIDPSPELLRYARKRAEQARPPVELREGAAEALPLETGSFDCVTVTWTLCSVDSVERVLAELRRVLRSGGTLRFAEHGLSPDPGVQKWQRGLTPIWHKCAGNCHLDRSPAHLLKAAGFVMRELNEGYARGPKPMVYMYQGVAEAA